MGISNASSLRRLLAASVVLALATVGCGRFQALGPIPSDWKTFHGDGWIMRYPPTFAAEIFSHCSITVFAATDDTQIQAEACDTYPGTHYGLGRAEVAFFLVDPSRVPERIRAREIAPPLRLAMVQFSETDNSYWDGMSNIALPPIEVGFKDVRIQGRDYQLLVSFSNEATSQDRETVDRILASIQQSPWGGGPASSGPSPSP
jgi:hypothetical protein